MKKFLALIASVILAVSLFTFAGCGEDKGTIKGNYKEATAEEVQTALESVDEEKLKENVNGLEIGSKLDFSMTADGKTSKVDINVGGKLTLGEEIFASLTFGMKTTGEENEELKVNAYLSGDYAYADIVGDAVGESGLKAKVNYADLLQDLLPEDEEFADGEIEGDFTLDIGKALELLKTYKINVGMDTSDGLKFKLSVTEETVWTILESFVPEFAIYENMVTFNSFVFDCYFSINKDGSFGMASTKVNIDAKISIPAIQGPSPKE